MRGGGRVRGASTSYAAGWGGWGRGGDRGGPSAGVDRGGGGWGRAGADLAVDERGDGEGRVRVRVGVRVRVRVTLQSMSEEMGSARP